MSRRSAKRAAQGIMTLSEAAKALRVDKEWLRSLTIGGALKRADVDGKLLRFERSYIEGLVVKGWKPPGYH